MKISVAILVGFLGLVKANWGGGGFGDYGGGFGGYGLLPFGLGFGYPGFLGPWGFGGFGGFDLPFLGGFGGFGGYGGGGYGGGDMGYGNNGGYGGGNGGYQQNNAYGNGQQTSGYGGGETSYAAGRSMSPSAAADERALPVVESLKPNATGKVADTSISQIAKKLVNSTTASA